MKQEGISVECQLHTEQIRMCLGVGDEESGPYLHSEVQVE